MWGLLSAGYLWGLLFISWLVLGKLNVGEQIWLGYTMQTGPESNGVEFSQIRDNAVEDLFAHA